MTQHTTYSAADITATLDGRQIIGFDEGDNVLEVAPVTNRSEIRVGATGSSIISVSTNRAARITLRLMHNSATHRLLSQKNAQMLSGVRRPFSFSYKEVGSGEGGAASRCMIEQAPTKSHGLNATVREWILVTGEWSDDIPNEAQS